MANGNPTQEYTVSAFGVKDISGEAITLKNSKSELVSEFEVPFNTTAIRRIQLYDEEGNSVLKAAADGTHTLRVTLAGSGNPDNLSLLISKQSYGKLEEAVTAISFTSEECIVYELYLSKGDIVFAQLIN